MTDIRPFLDAKLHITVWFRSKCRYCRTITNVKVHDYGVLKYEELDKKLDDTKHYLTPFPCRKCGRKLKPEELIYHDELRNSTIHHSRINYGNMVEGELSEQMEEEQKNRIEIFKEHEAEFWDKYTDYAIANWRDLVNELNDFEFRDAYKSLEIESKARTLAQYRKDALNRFKTIEEKQKFWRAANEYFIYRHLLEIGPLGWVVEKDAKQYGKRRMRFIILHFPIGESFEEMRTEWIGRVIRREKGDNDFLFRRIAMLTDELNRTRQRVTKYVFQIEELKAEKAKLEEKLSLAYDEIRKEKENKTIIHRDPNDVEKILELKSFISELLSELKEKEKLIREFHDEKEVITPTPELEETDKVHEQDTIERLSGKTVAIIGGRRQEQAQKEYPCMVLTHSGETLDPEYYQTLKQADIIIVLTQFISHLAMWEAKAYALKSDIPIFFMKGLNIPNLLAEVSKQLRN